MHYRLRLAAKRASSVSNRDEEPHDKYASQPLLVYNGRFEMNYVGSKYASRPILVEKRRLP